MAENVELARERQFHDKWDGTEVFPACLRQHVRAPGYRKFALQKEYLRVMMRRIRIAYNTIPLVFLLAVLDCSQSYSGSDSYTHLTLSTTSRL